MVRLKNDLSRCDNSHPTDMEIYGMNKLTESKREEVLFIPMIKTLIPSEKKKSRDDTKRPKRRSVGYTTNPREEVKIAAHKHHWV